MKKIRNLLIILVLIGGLLFASNPSTDAHKKKVIAQFTLENPLVGKLGGAKYFAKILRYDDYYLFSTSNISMNDKRVSIGIAGYVFVLYSLDIKEYKQLIK